MVKEHSKGKLFKTLCLIVSSADNLCKTIWPQIRPDKAFGPDLDPNCLKH